MNLRRSALAVAIVFAVGSCSDSSPTGPGSPAAIRTFPSGDITLRYLLDLPPGSGPFPALVLGHGSGPVTAEQAADLAHDMVARGFAVLRYDKRGAGESGGVYSGLSTANSETLVPLLAGDMLAGVAFLQTLPAIRRECIGLIGASQAGWIVPHAAAASDEVKFTILLSGPTLPVGVNIYYEQTAADLGRSLDELSALLAGYTGPRGYDPLPRLGAGRVPGLWLYGEQDRLVPVRESRAILDVLAGPGRPYRYIVYPGVGHNVRAADTLPAIDAWLGSFGC